MAEPYELPLGSVRRIATVLASTVARAETTATPAPTWNVNSSRAPTTLKSTEKGNEAPGLRSALALKALPAETVVPKSVRRPRAITTAS